jgi:hypothetical protein
VYGITVSPSTVRSDLEALDWVPRRRPSGPRRRQGDCEARVLFCKAGLKLDMSRMLFSDEKLADCNDQGLWEWCAPGEQPSHRERDRWSPKIHIWGIVGVGVRKLVFLSSGTVDHEKYIKECLAPCLREGIFKHKVFMQDGAKSHTAVASQEWLKKNRVNYIEDWPARSPDLNPIEKLWSILQQAVDKRGPTDEESLKQFVQEEWDAACPQSVIDSTVMTWHRSLRACIKKKGITLCRSDIAK